MRECTRLDVEQWWRDVFDVRAELWSTLTVLHPHALLDDYEGWYVAWRGNGVHISAPSTAADDEVAALNSRPAPSLQTAEFWQAFADRRDLELVGPSTHFYLDVDPGPSSALVRLGADDLRRLEALVTPQEWSEGGMAHVPPIAFGIVENGLTVATAGLHDWRGVPSDLGVVVAPSHRGRGLGAVVAGHAASYAVRAQGIARWRAATANVASTRTAQRLGFEPYATQLAVRRGSSAA